jgi:hypothetical protein
MAGYVVDASLFDDERFQGCSLPAQYTMFVLLASNIRMRIPGLVRAGPKRLAEQMRVTEAEAESYLTMLEQATLIEVDRDRLVIRIPDACRYPSAVARNPNILTRWKGDWGELPPSELKWKHIASLTHACSLHTPSMLQKFEHLFGSELRWWASQSGETDLVAAFGWLAENSVAGYTEIPTGQSVKQWIQVGASTPILTVPETVTSHLLPPAGSDLGGIRSGSGIMDQGSWIWDQGSHSLRNCLSPEKDSSSDSEVRKAQVTPMTSKRDDLDSKQLNVEPGADNYAPVACPVGGPEETNDETGRPVAQMVQVAPVGVRPAQGGGRAVRGPVGVARPPGAAGRRVWPG